MSNLATIERNGGSTSLARWNSEQMGIIKAQIAPGCTDNELALFGQVCGRTGLDPFARQIYAIKRGKGDKAKMTIQTSIDGFRLIADRTGKYCGSQTFWCDRDGIWVDVWLKDYPPAAAKTEVWKKGSDRPFVGVARFDSYKQEVDEWKNGQIVGRKLSDMWERMPDNQIAKCSEALALRKGFPAELSGLYTSDEMGQADTQEVEPPQPVEVKTSPTSTDKPQPKSKKTDNGFEKLWKTFEEGLKKATDIEAIDSIQGWLESPKQWQVIEQSQKGAEVFLEAIVKRREELGIKAGLAVQEVDEQGAIDVEAVAGEEDLF